MFSAKRQQKWWFSHGAAMFQSNIFGNHLHLPKMFILKVVR
jgi:hypothetical protein